LNWNIATA